MNMTSLSQRVTRQQIPHRFDRLSLAVMCLLGAAAFAPSTAFAVPNCSPATGDNVTVTCSGAVLNQGPGANTGYGSGLQNGLTINVVAAPPSSVTGTSTGIDVGSNNVINNFGTVTTAGSGGVGDIAGINANGTNLTVNNSGTIGRLDIPGFAFSAAGISAFGTGLSVTNNAGATIQGQIGIQGNGTADITNSGLIQGAEGGDGINVAGGSVTVKNLAGTITGNATGITADLVTVTHNFGTISAPATNGFSGGTAINASTSLDVTNDASGMITSDGSAITAPTITVTNFGTISSSSSGISGGTVTVTNSKSILGGIGFAAISMTTGVITNNASGTISGDLGITAFGNATIFNAGTITGNGGTAIAFSSGGNTLTLGPGSVINGTAQGFGADTFQLGGTGTDSLNAGLFATQYSGYTTFNKVDASTWTLTGTGGNQAWNVNGGTLVAGHQTAGTIDALGTGDITMNGGTLRSTVTGTFNNNLTFNTNTSSVVSAAAGQTVTFGPNGVASVVTFGDNSIATFGSATDTGTVVISSGTNTVFASAQIVVAGGTLRDGNGVLGNTMSFIQSTTVNAGAILDMNDQTDGIHILLGAGTVITGTNPATTLFLLSGDENTGNFSSHLFSGVIKGPGSVEVGPVGLGGGQTILTGTNIYTGGTFIQDNTILQLGNGGSTGSIIGNVLFGDFGGCGCGPGALVFDRSDSYTFAGTISGPGTVVQAGTGTAILTADSDYTGGTVISSGNLQLGNGGTTGSIVGDVTFCGCAPAALIFDRSNSYTFGGTISGPGSVVQAGTGTTILTADSDYSGGTTISSGTLQVGVATVGSPGSITSSAIGTGTLTFNGGTLQAGGNFTIANAGAVNTTGGTIDSNGHSFTLSGVIGNGNGTTGALTILDSSGGGTVTFSGANTYSGTTTIGNGTTGVTLKGAANYTFSLNSATTVNANAMLDLGGFNQAIGSLAGAGKVTNSGVSNAALTAGGNNSSTTFSGVIQDGTNTTALTKTGNGTLVLSGTSSYTGATTVSGGVLDVEGSLGHTAVTVGSGATLEGNGSIAGSVTIAGGGTLMPGDAPGTITVGPLTLNAGSNLSYQLGTPNVVGGPTNDLTIVNGALTINGGTLFVSNSGSFGPGVYQIIDYTGTLGGSGHLAVGTLPNGDTGVIETTISGEINLVVSGPGALTQFWDGATTAGDGTVHGGSGTWNNSTTNWTTPNGAINASWQGGMAVFAGAAGTVTVSAPVSYQGLQFSTTGYTVTATGSGALTPTGVAPVIVDGGLTATISAPITGSGGLQKTGLGTLILSGTNTYAGGTNLNAGTLGIGNSQALGTGALAMASSTVLQAEGSGFNITNAIAITGAGTFDTNGFGLTLSGIIADGSSAGSMTKIGTGTLIQTGTSSYTGATNVNAGTLQAGAANAFAPASAFTVASGAFLALNSFSQTIGSLAGAGNVTLGSATLTTGGNNASTIFAGGISGSGGLTKTGSGTFTLSGANAYTGATNINGGSLTLSGSGSIASSSGVNVTNAAATFDISGVATGTTIKTLSGVANSMVTLGSNALTLSNASGTFNGVISGTGGSLIQTAGTETFTGSDTYTGGTTISAGTFVVGNNSALGTGLVKMAAGTTLSFLTANFTIANNFQVSGDPFFTPPVGTTQTLSGAISDGASPGVVDMTGAGTLVLSGLNTYSGGTVISAGTLQVTNNSSGGTGTVTLDGGAFQSGAAGLAFANPFAINTTGGTIDTQANTLTLSGAIGNGTGTGALTKIGTGTLVLTGTDTYTGGTTISAGTLQLGSGGTSGSILGNVVDSGTFAINRSDTYKFGGVISGTGAFDQNGTGTTILTATNSYTGATNVNSGALDVTGSIATSSLTSVNNGATLVGNGTVGKTQINSGGTFAPGTPGVPGTSMTVAGNLAFQSGALYIVQLNPTSTTMTNVTGAASLAGNVLAAFASGSYMAKQYDILHSGGLNGTTFGSFATVNLPAGFNASLSYTTTDVLLNFAAVLGQQSGLNGNQQNVATAINNFFNGGGTLTPNFLALFKLSGGNLANALTQLDGEAAVDGELVAFQSMTEFLGLMLDPFVDGRSGVGGPGGGQARSFAPDEEANFPPDVALAYNAVLKAPPKQPTFGQRWTAWGAAYGGSNTTNGDPVVGSTDVTAHTYGFAGGMDSHVTPDTVLGFALAGGGTNWGLAQGLGGGRSDAFQAGVYGRTYFGPAYVAASLAFANNWMTTNRIAFAGDQLTARFNAQSYGGRIETGYRYAVLPMAGVTPYAALQTQSFHTPNYGETDLTGGGFGLTYNTMTASDTRSELGARFDDLTMFNGMPLTLRARAAWAHDWVSNPALGAVFQALPGASFVVNGPTLPKDSALAGAGAELHITPALSLRAKFDGEFASGSQTYAGTGTVRYSW
jgi:fibronectin-binding autotransporter adhesin